MGARFLFWLFVLFIIGSGIGAILDGAALFGVSQFALAVAVVLFDRWRRRRRAAIEMSNYMRQARVDFRRRDRRR
jgi:hypothetical protein